MSNNDFYLPQVSWSDHEKLFKLFVEEDESALGDQFGFLKHLGFISDNVLGAELTELGQQYYDARFIRSDIETSNTLLKESLLKFPPAEILLQLLNGVNNAKRDNALSVLKSRDFWYYDDETPLTHFLLLLNQVGLVAYSKKLRTLRILYNIHDSSIDIPPNIFIDSSTPYANIEWLRKVLKSCTNHIFWLDKHFVKQGLSYIWETADANRVKNITVLSISLKEHDKKTIDEYRRLKKELTNKNIKFNWLIIDSKEIRDSHDRWILTKDKGWNLPDINTVLSGSRSEINESPNYKEVIGAFRMYAKEAKELGC